MLELEAGVPNDDWRIVLLDTGGQPLGITVDAVHEIVKVDPSQKVGVFNT